MFATMRMSPVRELKSEDALLIVTLRRSRVAESAVLKKKESVKADSGKTSRSATQNHFSQRDVEDCHAGILVAMLAANARLSSEFIVHDRPNVIAPTYGSALSHGLRVVSSLTMLRSG